MERRVLIIEDDPDVRRDLVRALEGEGVHPVLATDASEGLAQLRGGPVPAAILLDLRAPRQGGEAFLREVRADARYERVPVITMSAGAERPEVVAHVRRPFDLEDLLAILMSLFEATAAEA